MILTGDGADQLFCGSSIYDDIRLIHRTLRIFNNFRNGYTNYNKPFDTINNVFARKQKIVKGLLKYDNKPITYNNKIKNPHIKYMLFDITTFLQNNLFYKTYYPSKYYNVDLTSPISDFNVVEYSFKIKHKLKYFNGNKKYVLKQILYDYIPEDLLSNQKKDLEFL